MHGPSPQRTPGADVPRTIVHTGRRIRVAVDTEVTAHGVTITRDAILHPGAVVILPVIDRNTVCLLRNRRPIVNETLWECPAGTLEPGEPIEHAARRELTEETGYTAARWTSLGYLFASPGVLDEKLHLFIAEDLTPGPMQLEPDEDLQPHAVPLADAVQMCLDGTIRDAKTVTALLLWERRLGKG
jgi:ADP-ribose pyrophosphatase